MKVLEKEENKGQKRERERERESRAKVPKRREINLLSFLLMRMIGNQKKKSPKYSIKAGRTLALRTV